MLVTSGQSITVTFTTRDPATGEAADADATPAGTLVVDGVDHAATVTVTAVSTGRYRAAFTLPNLSVGQGVELFTAATVSGVSDASVVWAGRVDVTVSSRSAYTGADTSGTTALLAMTSGTGANRKFTAAALENMEDVVWTADDRTLSEYPPTMTSTVPAPAIGLFAAGATTIDQQTKRRANVIAGTSIALLARMTDVNGDYVAPGTTSTVVTVVTNAANASDTSTVSYDVEDTVLGGLTLDGRWVEDGIGYNVAVPILGNRLATSGTIYRVTLTLTDDDGHTATARWDLQT